MLSRIIAIDLNSKQIKDTLRVLLEQTQRVRPDWTFITQTLGTIIRQLTALETREAKVCVEKLRKAMVSRDKAQVQLAINDCLFYLSHL